MQDKKWQLEPDMEKQRTGSKLGKEYVKAVYSQLACLTYMQSTSCENARLDESQVGVKIAGRNINNLRYADDTTLMVESESEVAQSCPILCDPVDCSPSSSSVHGILQARILVWVAISFSRGCSRPRDQTQVSCIAGRRFIL